MRGEQTVNDLDGRGRRRVIHHRKSASDTLAFAASALFNELPSPMPQALAATYVVCGPTANRSFGGISAETHTSLNSRAGFAPSDLLEVLKDMDEDGLEEFDVDDLYVDDLDVEEEADAVVCDMGDAAASAPAYPDHAAAAAEASRLGLPSVATGALATLELNAITSLEPATTQQELQQQEQLCDDPDTRRRATSSTGVGDGRHRQSASSMVSAQGAMLGSRRSSPHVRHPSDPLSWPAGPLLLEKPLSEFAGQTRANALDPSQLDPKRAKRIIANRQSAHRSRMKKLQVIHDLEQQVSSARTAADSSRQQMAAAAVRRRKLMLAALEAQCQLEGLRRQVAAAAALHAALVSELQVLEVPAQTLVHPEQGHAHVHEHAAGSCDSAAGEAAMAADAAAVGGGCGGASLVSRGSLCMLPRRGAGPELRRGERKTSGPGQATLAVEPAAASTAGAAVARPFSDGGAPSAALQHAGVGVPQLPQLPSGHATECVWLEPAVRPDAIEGRVCTSADCGATAGGLLPALLPVEAVGITTEYLEQLQPQQAAPHAAAGVMGGLFPMPPHQVQAQLPGAVSSISANCHLTSGAVSVLSLPPPTGAPSAGPSGTFAQLLAPGLEGSLLKPSPSPPPPHPPPQLLTDGNHRQHHRPLHRRHFSEGCAVERIGGGGGCSGSSSTRTVAVYGGASAGSGTGLLGIGPPPHATLLGANSTTTAGITTVTTLTATGSDAAVAALPLPADSVADGHLPMRMSATPTHGHGLPVFAANVKTSSGFGLGSADGTCYSSPGGSSKVVGISAAGVEGAVVAAVHGVMVTESSSAVVHDDHDCNYVDERGRDGSPMALDYAREHLMPDVPDVEDFLVKEEPRERGGPLLAAAAAAVPAEAARPQEA